MRPATNALDIPASSAPCFLERSRATEPVTSECQRKAGISKPTEFSVGSAPIAATLSATFFTVLIPTVNAFGQAQQQQPQEAQPNVIEKYGPRRQISTIVYCGLAGAVLGLSTLSFYGRPQDKLTSIPIGFGIGVVIGTIYVTYQAAANPDEFYRESRYEYKPDFTFPNQNEQLVADYYYQQPQPSLGYSWNF